MLLTAALLPGVVLPAHGASSGAVSRTTSSRASTIARAAPLSYEKDILPLFRARCLGCHRNGRPEAGLVVEAAGDLVQGGHSGPAVVPGSPERSLLVKLLADGRMPKGGAKLPAAGLRRVEEWIRAGAPGVRPGGHWAFRSPVAPRVPRVRAAAKVRNPVDAFVLAALERRGLAPAPEADRRTLIRRATYDLIGLPPTPREVEAFVHDPSGDAYERLVDRLLADPRCGERWARHWLDVAGYADSEGVLQEDRIRPNAWRYRDYVIRSFNADKPYDRFLREQLAGDEMVDWRNAAQWTPEMTETLTATGFLRTAVDATRDDFNPHQYGEYQYRMLHDTQTIVATAAMGLTVQCSRCHDHKYEPLSQKDYYRLEALFMGAVRPRGTKLPSAARQIVAATAADQKRAAETNAKVDAALAALARKEAALVREFQLQSLREHLERVPESRRASLTEAASVEEARRTAVQKALLEKYRALLLDAQGLAAAYPEFKSRQQEIQRSRAAETAKRVVYPSLRAIYDQDASPDPTPLLTRGDWLRPGEAVAPGIPAVLEDPRHPFVLPPPGKATTYRRKAFAEWLTRPDHPLTARVLVNRVWALHFGEGIVPTLENFGRSGAAPTNRALLDWLASTFTRADGETERGRDGETPSTGRSPSLRPSVTPSTPLTRGCAWSIKALHRLILTSATYRQSSRVREWAAANGGKVSASPEKVDPDDHYLWRQRPRRLDAEAFRDGVLAVSGTLDPTMYGEPVNEETRPTGEIVAAGEGGRERRSIYLLVRRSMPVNVLNLFDSPVMETNCTRRIVSTTPAQALALTNGSFLSAQAGQFAKRLLSEAPAGERLSPGQVERAFRLAFSRAPSATERAAALDFLRSQAAVYLEQPGTSPAAAEERACADFCQSLLSANEFIYLD